LPNEHVIVAEIVLATPAVETMNVPVEEPAETVAVAGTDAPVVAERLTTSPLGPAGPFNVMVP
jgi:hypothetical protein